MAADFFFFASLEARFLSLPCSHQLLFTRFRLPPSPCHTVRLSAAAANLKFTHPFICKPSNSSSDSVSNDLHILSATECSDGSVIFRFGNAVEMKMNKVEQSQSTNEGAKDVITAAGKNLGDEDMNSVNVGEVSDGELIVAEPVSKNLVPDSKVKSQAKRKPRRKGTKVVDIVKEKAASVITNEREGERDYVESSEQMHPDPEESSVQLVDVVEVEDSSSLERKDESTSKSNGATNSNMALTKDLVPDVEEVSAQLAALAVESENNTRLDSSESSPKIGVPQDYKLQEENSGAAKGNSENVGKFESSTLSMVSKVELVPDVEKNSPSLAGPAAESEIQTESASEESGFDIQVPHGVKFQEDSSVSEGHGEKVGKIEGDDLNMVSRTDIVSEANINSPPPVASAADSEPKHESTSLESSTGNKMPNDVKCQEDKGDASDENGENVGKIEDTTLNTEPKIDLALEEIHSQVGASETNSESEITAQSTSLGLCSSNEESHSLEFQESGKNNDIEEAALQPVPYKEHSKEQSMYALKSKVINEDANESDVGEVKPNAALSDVDSTLDEEAVHKTMDDSVDNDKVKSSNMSDDGVPFSILKEEITEADAKGENKVRVLVLKPVDLQSGGTTLEREEISTAGFFLYSGAAVLPTPTMVFAGGEDAYFIACQNWLGVADGAGQWSLEGICAGLYAKELMDNCEKIVSDRNSGPITDPVEVLNAAAVNARSCGSSTVVVAYFDDWALNVANIGDSGFMIIRNGAVFKRSSPMIYALNFPVQIERGDHPSDFVEVYRTSLNEGDVIITATDGLFDNLYEQDIASIVFKSLQKRMRPQEIAELLATRAQEVGQLSSVRSPFADEAQAAGYVGCRGGKLDDVAVIVSLVKRRFINHA